MKKIFLGIVLVLLAALLMLYSVGRGSFGRHETPGVVTTSTRPASALAEADASRAQAAENIGVSSSKQILFGDLHVHTTFSFDAFSWSFPAVGGEGAHPPADACDFARFCSALDFWSINDHAENLTPTHWRETIDSIRQCNAVSGDPSRPDTVAFLGWEWTQAGLTPDSHYGHKNVVLAHTEEDRIPARPILAINGPRRRIPTLPLGWIGLKTGGQRMHDFVRFLDEVKQVDSCAEGVHVRDLPTECLEGAATPADLFRKLDEWQHEAMVIPHGTTWGLYTPPTSSWDKQLRGAMHDPKRQKLIEVYSGHGDAERYRDWRALERDAGGRATCPEPRDNYLPTCWQAGEIIRARCGAEGHADAECERRARVARQHAADAGSSPQLAVPGARPSEWLDAGQCQDCDQPAFNHRPGGSAQYILALGDFLQVDSPLDSAGANEPEQVRRFRLGFIASSDSHFARPGTGYKEMFRAGMTDSQSSSVMRSLVPSRAEEPTAASREVLPGPMTPASFEVERAASFFTTGGLVAVHAPSRDRSAIWDGLQRRETYGTSGPRILLWFDLLNPPSAVGDVAGAGVAPMGSEVEMNTKPIFRARAVGSFAQKPGCPSHATTALDPDRLQHLCKGECYHPSDRRRAISRIEVVRIRPQLSEREDVGKLIEDPWKVFACDRDPTGCTVSFGDPDFVSGGRDTLYYVRAYEDPTPAINADNLRCLRDDQDNCVEARPCTETGDDCLAEQEPRAWSSPIYVDSPMRSASVRH